ncbi:MAG: glycosyltransferase family 4 protein [Bryobacterales bacterium]|nr:glycosyltransferase family 4 protein [Bryobacterales bacterium]
MTESLTPFSGTRRQYRLVAISDTYPPVVGGAEMDTQRVSAELIRRGHQVTVFCSGGSPMPRVRDWLDSEGVPVRILTANRHGRLQHLALALRAAWELWRTRAAFDIVFFSMSGLYLATGLMASRLLGKAILSKMHGSTVIPSMARSFIGRLELRMLAKWAARVMVLNDEMVQEALDAGIPATKLMHMPNPIDVDAFSPVSSEMRQELRARLRIPQSAQVLLYTGRLSHEKGLVWLMDAFALAAEKLPEAMLVLVGDGPMREALEQQAKERGLGPGSLRFAGRVAAAEVPDWLRAADAFALVSPNEGFSCALAEAMSVGLPAVVSAIPANVQLIDDGVHGYTAPPGDAAATASAIQRLLSDSEGQGRMGKAARQRVVENYSLGEIVGRYESLFAEILPPSR